MTALRIHGLGDVQIAALAQEILDPIHAELSEEFAFPGTLEGDVLTVEPGGFAKAQSLLEDAANGLGDPGPQHDGEYSRALWSVVKRLRVANKEAAGEHHSPICNGVDCAPSCRPIR